jgi:hypothetical protein
VIILDNIGRSENASVRAVQLSDKSFSGDNIQVIDWIIINSDPVDLTINKKCLEI